MRFAVIAALVLVAGCKTSPASSSPPADAGVATAVVDAGAPAAPPLDDLLHQTPTTVTLSSRVDNPRDYPEHIADGKPGTAWNGKTGDLAGWIDIAIPAGATATSIAITAGFDKGDLFTQNHRIRRVALLRDGKELKVVTLDPEKRTLQPIAIDVPAPGGTYRLVVRETLPGKKKAWRELVVSELAVLGHAGAAREPLHLAKVEVAPGSAPAPRVASIGPAWNPSGRTAPSLAAFCTAWKADVAREVAHDLAPGTSAEAECKEDGDVPAVTGLAPGWKRYRAVGISWFNGVMDSNSRLLVIEKDDGSIVIGPSIGGGNDLGCFSTPERVGFALVVKGDELLEARTFVTPWAKDNGNEGPLEEDGGSLEQDVIRCPVATLACTPSRTVFQRHITQPELVKLRKTPPAPRFE